jgi:hypothetical protein
MKVQVKDIPFTKDWTAKDKVGNLSGRLLGEISEEELVQAVAQTKSSAGRELMVIPEVMPVMDEEDE